MRVGSFISLRNKCANELVDKVNFVAYHHITTNDPALQIKNECLLDIATAFASIDFNVTGAECASWMVAEKNAANSLDNEEHITAQKELQRIKALRAPLVQLYADGEPYGFHEGYLKDTSMLKSFQKTGNYITAIFNCDTQKDGWRPFTDSIHDLMQKLQLNAEILADRIPAAATLGLLSSEERSTIRLRMRALDDLFDIYSRKTSTERVPPFW